MMKNKFILSAVVGLILSTSSISVNAQAVPENENYFSCSPVTAQPFTYRYINDLGVKGWVWPCTSATGVKTYNVIIRLKKYYVPSLCVRGIDSFFYTLWDNTAEENLAKMNKLLITCQRLPAEGTPGRALYDGMKVKLLTVANKEL